MAALPVACWAGTFLFYKAYQFFDAKLVRDTNHVAKMEGLPVYEPYEFLRKKQAEVENRTFKKWGEGEKSVEVAVKEQPEAVECFIRGKVSCDDPIRGKLDPSIKYVAHRHESYDVKLDVAKITKMLSGGGDKKDEAAGNRAGSDPGELDLEKCEFEKLKQKKFSKCSKFRFTDDSSVSCQVYPTSLTECLKLPLITKKREEKTASAMILNGLIMATAMNAMKGGSGSATSNLKTVTLAISEYEYGFAVDSHLCALGSVLWDKQTGNIKLEGPIYLAATRDDILDVIRAQAAGSSILKWTFGFFMVVTGFLAVKSTWEAITGKDKNEN